jgi:hypothetical protein
MVKNTRSILRLSVTATCLCLAPVAIAAPMEQSPWTPGGECRLSSGEQCAVEVQFGSICCGPDRKAVRSVLGYVARSRVIQRAIQCPNGKEGEFTLCLAVAPGSLTQRVFKDLQAIAVNRSGPSKQIPVTVTTP